MKKLALLAALAMIAAPALADWPSDPAGTQTVLIPQLGTTPVIDGTVDSVWNTVPATTLNTWKIIAAPTDAADLTTWFKAGWKGNSLYYLVYIKDNDYQPNGQDARDLTEIYLSVTGDLTTPHNSAGLEQWDAAAGPTQFGFAHSDDLNPYGAGTNAHVVNDSTREAVTDSRAVYATSGGTLTAGNAYEIYVEVEIKMPAGVTLADETDAFPFMLAVTDTDAGSGWQTDDTFAAWWGTANAPWSQATTASLGTTNVNQWNDPKVWAATRILTDADDTDGDGIPDDWETDTGTYVGPGDTGTDPAVADTDGDGWNDGAEVSAGTDPNDDADHPAGNPPGVPVAGVAALIALAGATIAAAARKLR